MRWRDLFRKLPVRGFAGCSSCIWEGVMLSTVVSVRDFLETSAKYVFVGCLLLGLLVSNANAQTTSTDGTTPLSLTPGSPAGSNPLSGFDNINLFNGNLNFHLPVGHIGGRGEAQYTMMLPIENHWRV